MKKLNVTGILAALAIVLGAPTAWAWVGTTCSMCSGSTTLGVDIVNPETCQSQLSSNCPTSGCSSSDYLVACPLIKLLAPGGSSCSPSSRTIIMCDRWVDANTGDPVSSCQRCVTQTMTPNGSAWNPGSLYCTSTTSGPGSGDYYYEITVNDITGMVNPCDSCDAGCYQANCVNNGGCNGTVAHYAGCTISL